MSKLGTNHRIETRFDAGMIMLGMPSEISGIRETMWTHFLDLRDKRIRKVLIDLGWTPPNQKEPPSP